MQLCSALGSLETIAVVPCYNEARRLNRRTFRRFAAEHADIGVLLVNDGSRDATADLVDALAADYPGRIGSMHLASNCGKAEAVRRGVLAALDVGCHMVGYWDADLATPLEAIPQFRDVLRRRHDIEIVIGSRQQLLGHAVRRRPLRRRLGRLFARCASWLLGAPVHDTQCGAKLFRVHPRVREMFGQPFVSHWLFDVELLARRIRLQQIEGGRPWTEVIYELPLEAWEEVAGSKVASKDFVRAVGELWSIHRKYFARHPWMPDETPLPGDMPLPNVAGTAPAAEASVRNAA